MAPIVFVGVERCGCVRAAIAGSEIDSSAEDLVVMLKDGCSIEPRFEPQNIPALCATHAKMEGL